MVINRLEDLLGRYQEVCHLPHGHLKVHLRELEEPVPNVSQTSGNGDNVCWDETDLLKKRGMRMSDGRRSLVAPK